MKTHFILKTVMDRNLLCSTEICVSMNVTEYLHYVESGDIVLHKIKLNYNLLVNAAEKLSKRYYYLILSYLG